MVNIITRYDYEARALVAPGINFDPKDKKSRSVTNQADKETSDINYIMAKFEKTGLIDIGGVERKPLYGDFSSFGNYHTMLSAVRDMERLFNAYPAAVRNRFDNDPQKMVDFLADKANDAEAIRLGLKDAPPATPSPEVPTGTPVTGAPSVPPAP